MELNVETAVLSKCERIFDLSLIWIGPTGIGPICIGQVRISQIRICQVRILLPWASVPQQDTLRLAHLIVRHSQSPYLR
jgi:hypothetical protein